MKYPELFVIWVSNSNVELKKKDIQKWFGAPICLASSSTWGNPSQLMERQQRAKEYASIGPCDA